MHHKKLKVFGTTKVKISKEKQRIVSLKSDAGIFSRLYISCQTRDGNLEKFFCHENQAYPPAFSDSGKLHLGTKSDLLVYLELKNHFEEASVTTIS